MHLPKQEKVDSVAELRDRISSHEIAIMTHYIGMSVAQATALRTQLREAGVSLKVYKNTLARIALNDLGIADAGDLIQGPTAWAFSNDPVAPAKLLKDFGKKVKFVSMTGGILSGKAVKKEQLEALASLPPREQLIAMVVGTVAAPLRNFVGVLNAIPRDFVNVLDQIKRQKEEGGEAAA